MTFPIYQIVGYKNTGKTTLMEEMIRYYSNLGMEVGTLKHHGHGGPLKVAENTDSYRHTKSGSRISVAQGGHNLQINVSPAEVELERLIHIYTCFNVDILLIEGYKYADYPKIVLIKSEKEIPLLKKLTNIIAVGVRDEMLMDTFDHYTFSLNNIGKTLPKLIEFLQKN